MKAKEEIIRLLIAVFEKNGIKEATLFGSYAKGTQTENSDEEINNIYKMAVKR
ncbi:MAG: nucleotidyltransferase domain-containing protein [Eubacteriaceae bacterium]|jgi:predicted nucleotidyltransferase|uniref:Nucleotidyltransferase domain-containing protein n=1 Tax=Candidatus Pseudoramibacter fermentans TaxID=2594427 RepID=A0A6L5GSQ5_9FIRM|nr:nucleotidyltransferase domain-containing protein [Candidatus Pseudoramibacter fermentans]RRF92122.1 MAG: nucleotidyltransferase domain-containing protein [Eubacteriaceae bacterium]